VSIDLTGDSGAVILLLLLLLFLHLANYGY